jgi:hypothetical protein
LESVKLSVDSAGDGMADEGKVVEDKEEDDDSLMLTINTSAPVVLALLYPIFVLVPSSSAPSSSGPDKQKPAKFTVHTEIDMYNKL